MNYPDEFKELVLKSNPDNHNDYIGTGNPNAKVLIVGKECAIDTSTEESKRQSEKEITKNISDWKKNIENPNVTIEKRNFQLENLNPLYPYKGQNFTIYNKNQKTENYGTSRTWYNYQKLYNRIKLSNHNIPSVINFHEDIFITELNANTSNYSKDQNPEKRKNSIEERTNNLFKSDFIRNFPIIILATSHYPREHDIDICELFNVEFKEPTVHVDDDSKQWCNIHENKQGEKPKLLIHTKQLSMNISDNLLDTIANRVTKFAHANNIQL